mgnify:CR=1 FL=1
MTKPRTTRTILASFRPPEVKFFQIFENIPSCVVILKFLISFDLDLINLVFLKIWKNLGYDDDDDDFDEDIGIGQSGSG